MREVPQHLQGHITVHAVLLAAVTCAVKSRPMREVMTEAVAVSKQQMYGKFQVSLDKGLPENYGEHPKWWTDSCKLFWLFAA